MALQTPSPAQPPLYLYPLSLTLPSPPPRPHHPPPYEDLSGPLQVPRVLTVAGSDSGGGAGIQADLKTYQARGVFGTSAISALTAQNTRGVRGVHTVPTPHLSDQMEAVLSDIGADVVKTGMLPTAEVGLEGCPGFWA